MSLSHPVRMIVSYAFSGSDSGEGEENAHG